MCSPVARAKFTILRLRSTTIPLILDRSDISGGERERKTRYLGGSRDVRARARESVAQRNVTIIKLGIHEWASFFTHLRNLHGYWVESSTFSNFFQYWKNWKKVSSRNLATMCSSLLAWNLRIIMQTCNQNAEWNIGLTNPCGWNRFTSISLARAGSSLESDRDRPREQTCKGHRRTHATSAFQHRASWVSWLSPSAYRQLCLTVYALSID